MSCSNTNDQFFKIFKSVLGELILGNIGPLRSVMNVVSIDNDVLTKILVGTKSNLMWWRWLVDRPVVEWWVDDWVSNLSKFHILSFNLLSILLWDVNLIRSNSHVHTEISITHAVAHKSWVDMNWNTLLVLLSQDLLLLSSGGSSLLLWKRNLIWSDEDLHVKVGISHGVTSNNWVDIDRLTLGLSKSLFACDQILNLILLLNLSKLGGNRSWLIGHQVLEHSGGNVVLHKSEGSTLSILSPSLTLSEFGGDRSWL